MATKNDKFTKINKSNLAESKLRYFIRKYIMEIINDSIHNTDDDDDNLDDKNVKPNFKLEKAYTELSKVDATMRDLAKKLKTATNTKDIENIKLKLKLLTSKKIKLEKEIDSNI